MQKHYVILRLEGVLQSWSVTSPWNNRATLNRPTKSGVIGLIANALGLDRSDNIDWLADSVFHCRSDRPGIFVDDIQTAGSAKEARLLNSMPRTQSLNGSGHYEIYAAPRNIGLDAKGNQTHAEGSDGVMSTRQYISDGSFLVGIGFDSSDDADKVASALANPARPLFLGRNRATPTKEVLIGQTQEEWSPTPLWLQGMTYADRSNLKVHVTSEVPLALLNQFQNELEMGPLEQPATYQISESLPRHRNYHRLPIVHSIILREAEEENVTQDQDL